MQQPHPAEQTLASAGSCRAPSICRTAELLEAEGAMHVPCGPEHTRRIPSSRFLQGSVKGINTLWMRFRASIAQSRWGSLRATLNPKPYVQEVNLNQNLISCSP